MVFIVLVLLGIAFTTLLIDGVSGNSTIGDMGTNTLLRDVLFLAFLVIVFWLDHIQSILIAVLLGIGLPRINRESAFLLIVAPIAFLTLQVMSYLLIAVAYILLRIVVFGILGAGFGSVIVLNSLTMCTIFFYRESLISLLWYFVRQRYDALYPITLQERFNTITDIA